MYLLRARRFHGSASFPKYAVEVLPCHNNRSLVVNSDFVPGLEEYRPGGEVIFNSAVELI